MRKVFQVILFGLVSFVALSGASFVSYAQSAQFSDLPSSHPSFRSVKYLQEEGVISGYDDGTFKPDRLVNRAEALKIILAGSRINSDNIEDMTSPFSDMRSEDWFAKFVLKARELGIVNGNPDGTFAPGRNVQRADFIKMLLLANRFQADNWDSVKTFSDIPGDAWFAPYMNYAGTAGLITPDSNNSLNPARDLSRAEVADILYVMSIILRGQDLPFLIKESEMQMVQIETYIKSKNIAGAKRAAELAVDMTQQAYRTSPDNSTVLTAAKLAKAYDLLVTAFIAALEKNLAVTEHFAEQAKTKATEAWETDNSIQPIAKLIKDRADDIVAQLKTKIAAEESTN